MMFNRQLFDQETWTYTYLIADPATGKAALIDPVREQVDRDLGLIEQLGFELAYVIETHVHADHVTAAGELRARTGARTVAGKLGAACADLHLDHGDTLPLGELTIRALATPGHTDDSMSFVVDGHVFTGDTLFIRGTGRADFQNGDPAALYRSITEVLFALPDATVVWPGHDYKGNTSSTIGEEKRFNPRVAGRSRDEFITIMNNLGLPAPKKLAESVPANRRCGQKQESFRDVEVDPEGIAEIDPRTLSAQPRHRLIDVREPNELAGDLGALPHAELVPLATVEHTAVAWDRDEPLVVVCRSGRRSGRAVKALQQLGFRNVVNLRGGMLAVRSTAGVI